MQCFIRFIAPTLTQYCKLSLSIGGQSEGFDKTLTGRSVVVSENQGGTRRLGACNDKLLSRPGLGDDFDTGPLHEAVRPWLAIRLTRFNMENGSSAEARPVKKRRIPKACSACRAKKLACDERRPCSRCSKAGVECVYFERPKDPRAYSTTSTSNWSHTD